jgi:hypothetical protein
MRYSIIFLWFLFTLVGLQAQTTITVTSPNGGETWAGASTQNISWTSSGVTQVNIDFSTDGGSSWVPIATNHSALSTPYPWLVPGAGPLGSTQCRVRVTSATNSLITDMSDNNFTIPPSGIIVMVPNGGESYQNGQMASIRWSAQSIVNVDIDYSSNNGSTWTAIITNIPAARTFYSWVIPTGINSSQMRVRVKDNSNSNVLDVTDASFTVSPPRSINSRKYRGGNFDGYSRDNNLLKSITVTSPNGGEVWNGASMQNITWNSQNVDNVRIEFSSNNGSTWNVIQSTYPAGTGTFPWQVPSAGTTGSTQCLVRVSNATDLNLTDLSNGTWTIPASLVTVLSPDGAEVFYNGSMRPIRWTSQSVVDVRIEYSTNLGSTWNLITDSIPAPRTFFSWLVPTGVNSQQALIRVMDRLNPTVADTSNNVFLIRGNPTINSNKFRGGSFDGYASDNSAPKSLQLLTPNGGETWSGATIQNVTWTSQNISNVMLEFSTNNGSSWNTIINTYPASTGTFPWTVPGAGPLGSTQCRVRVSDATDNTLNDISDAVWTIPPASLSLLSPSNGDIFFVESSVSLRWTSQSVLNVRLEYSTNNGSNWLLINDSIPSNRTFFSWVVPSTAVSSQCKIKILDRIDPSVTDQNSGVFTIRATPAINSKKYAGGSFDGYASDIGCIEPVATISGAQTLCPGNSTAFSVTLENSPPWNLTWTDGNASFTASGLTSSPYVLQVTPSAHTTYSITNFTGGCQGVGIGQATADVNTPPTAALSGNNTILLGQGTTLTLTMSGQGPWDIQYTDGSSTFSSNGITSNPYLLTLSPTADITYSLVSVLNPCIGTVSGSAAITVNSVANAVLSGSQSLCAGSVATLTVNINGPSPWNLTWTDGITPTTVSGLTQSPYLIQVSPSSSRTYSLVSVTNQIVGNVSGTAEIPVTPIANAVLTGTQSILITQSAALSIQMTGVAPWNVQYSDGIVTTGISGISSSPYIFSVTPSATTTYQLTGISNICTGTGSGSAVVTVHIPPTAHISGTQSICSGNSALLSVAFTGPGPWDLVWSDGLTPVSITGITQNPLILTQSPVSNTTYNLVSVSNTVTGTTSGSAEVMVRPVANAVISGTQSIFITQSAILSVNLSGVGPWDLSYSDGTSNTGMSGISSSPYLIHVTPSNTTTYLLTGITNTCTGSFSGSAIVTVNIPPTANITGGQNICSGNSATLSVSITGPGPWDLTWTDGSTPVSVTGITQNPYLIQVTPLSNTTYSLVSITNPFTGQVSGSAEIQVTSPPSNVSGLQVVSTGCTQVNWDWTPSNGANAYYADLASDLAFTSLLPSWNNALLGNTTTLTLTGMNPGTTVYARIRSNNQCFTSTNIPGVSGASLPLPQAVITSSSQSIECSQFTTSWLSSNHATSYALELSEQSNFSVLVNGYAPLSLGNVLTHTITGLNENTQYYWRISGVNSCGSGTASAGVAVMTPRLTGNITMSVSSPLCETGSLQLSATGSYPGAAYQWSGPNGFSLSGSSGTRPNITPQDSGSYQVSVTAAGCTPVILSSHVSVLQQAVILAVGGNTSLCSGETLVLTSSVQGGSLNYLWQGPNGFSASSQSLQRNGILPIDSGWYRLSLISPGCNTAQDSLLVQVIPSVPVLVSNTGPVCSGSALYLNATFIPGAPYLWSGPNGFSSSAQNPALSNVTLANSGEYTLHMTQPGCNPLMFITQAIVGSNMSSVVLQTNGPVCQSQTLSLSATHYPDATYLWTGPSGFTANTSVVHRTNATSAMSGQYSLTISNPGCTSISRSIIAQVNSGNIPVATITSPVCVGSTVTFEGSSHPNATYSWAGPNGFSVNIRTLTISQIGTNFAGVYTYTVSQSTCGVSSTTATLVVGNSISNISLQSNGPLCSGSTLQITSPTIAQTTVLWTAPDGFTSNTPILTRNNIQPHQAGVYSYLIVSPGCGSTSRTINISVTPLATLNSGSNTPLCSGNVMQLSVNAVTGGTYLWQGPLGWSSNTQSPSIASVMPNRSGIYTITVQQPGCGSIQTTTAVIVSQSLQGITSSSNSPVCLNSALGLSATVTSGLEYLWQGPGGFSSTSAIATRSLMTGTEAGIYTLTYGNAGCGSVTNSFQVLVNNPAVASISSTPPLCAGAILTLSGTGNRGSLYQWSGPNGYQANTAVASISNVQTFHAGEYSLSVTDPACGVLSFTTLVSVGANLNAAVPSSNAPVCESIQLNLSAGFVSGATYFWSGPNGFTSNLQNPSIANPTIFNSGIYTLTASTSGCPTVNRTIEVTVTPGITASAGNSSPVCQGAVVYLNSNFVSGASYTWTGPGGFSSVTQNPSIINTQPGLTGLYTLAITKPGCNPVTTTTSVIIGTAINAVNVVSNSPVCENGILSLSATVNSGYIYHWSGPNGFTSTLAQPTINAVTPINSGAYQLQVSSPGCGTIHRTLSAVVNTAPLITPGSNSPICQGQVFYLSTNTISGATYHWSGPNGFLSTNQNPGISNAQPIHSGVYTLTLNSLSCGSFSTTTNVIVGSTLNGVNILSNSPVCIGNTLSMSATVRPGFTYTWQGPNGFTSNIAEPSIPNFSSPEIGTYTVIFNSTGCGAATRSISIRGNDPSLVSASNSGPACVNGVIYFSGIAPAGSTYSWSGPMGFVSTAQSPSRTRVQTIHSGIYTMSAQVQGCGLISTTTNVSVTVCKEAEQYDASSIVGTQHEAGISESELSGKNNLRDTQYEYTLSIWPNPNEGDLVNLRWKDLSAFDNDITVKIYDATGKVIRVESIQRGEKKPTEVESGIEFHPILAKGMYTVESIHDGIRKYERFIVQ